jgi:hypothetical protein
LHCAGEWLAGKGLLTFIPAGMMLDTEGGVDLEMI